MSSGPDPGTVMIQPVKNGWVLLHWPPEPEPADEDDGDDDGDDDSDEQPGYDPSASFAASQWRQGQPPQVQLVGHMHMRDEGPEAERYVFTYGQQGEMLKFVAVLTKAPLPSS